MLDGRVVIVTGASSGLGEQLARALAAAGAVPVLAARRADRLARLRAELPGADAVTCDVTRRGRPRAAGRDGDGAPRAPRRARQQRRRRRHRARR